MTQLAIHDGFWKAMCRYDILTLNNEMEDNANAIYKAECMVCVIQCRESKLTATLSHISGGSSPCTMQLSSS